MTLVTLMTLMTYRMRKLYFVLPGLLIFSACSKPDNPTPTPPSPPPADTSGRPVNTAPPPVTPTDSAGWIRTGINTTFLDVWFTDSLHGVVTSADSMVYRSSDGGLNWKKALPQKYDLQSIFFLNSSQGFVVGIKNFAYTLDGGQSWVVKKNNGLGFAATKPPYVWPNIQFTSGSTGYVTTGTGLYKTTDTGTTWTMVNQNSVSGVCFTNPGTGHVYIADNQFSTTTDGGLTWSRITTVPGWDNSGSGSSGAVTVLQFTDDQHGWTSTGVNFAASTDGGNSWQDIYNLPQASLSWLDMQMLNNQVGFACNRSLLKTTDGGHSWQTIFNAPSTSWFASLFLLDAGHGWACGPGGLILKFNPSN